MFIQYSIKDTDRFDELQFPGVVREIAGLHQSVWKIKSAEKTAIIISLLKDHSIKTEWLQANKELARLLTSGALPTSHLESLFGSCKDNPTFRKGLEDYITAKLL
jgi:hypothetical protein